MLALSILTGLTFAFQLATAFRARNKVKRAAELEHSAQAVTHNSTVGGKVITLGDSYSSGVGLYTWDKDYEGGSCWQDSTLTGGAQYAQFAGMEYVNVACLGAELPDAARQFDKLQAKFPEDDTQGWAGSVIYFTIGGNDIRTVGGQTWPRVLRECIMSFYGACHEEAQNQMANFPELQEMVAQFYYKIAQAAPNAKIRVMGYPRMLTRTFHCLAVPGLALKAADWADVMVDELNGRLNAGVDQVRAWTEGAVDIEFVDVKESVDGGACWASFDKKINSIVLAGVSISDASFHPNPNGHDHYFYALAESVGTSVPHRVPAEISHQAVSQEMVRILDGWDTDKNGKLSKGELLRVPGGKPELLRTIFHKADEDQDDALGMEEFEEFMKLVAAHEAD